MPNNYILLFAFTIFKSISVGYICTMVNSAIVVVTAAFMTASLVIALTLYAIFTKTDFTACGGTLTVMGTTLLQLAFIMFFLGLKSNFIYNIIGVFFFGLYLVYDTQLIVGESRRKYSINKEDYILGAMLLYMDIIRIFKFLLRIFGKK